MYFSDQYGEQLSKALEERNEGSAPLSTVEEIMHHNLEGCVADCHAWVVDCKTEKILDYDTETILKTLSPVYEVVEIIRKPFSQTLQMEMMPYILRIIRLKKDLVRTSRCIDESQYKTKCMTTFGYCFLRVSYIMEKNVNKNLKIVLGSLGLRQPDGTVIYEYG